MYFPLERVVALRTFDWKSLRQDLAVVAGLQEKRAYFVLAQIP
jgi:hypothetical protein